VIAASATASTLEGAVSRAYRGVEAINFEGMFYRRDIAHRYDSGPLDDTEYKAYF